MLDEIRNNRSKKKANRPNLSKGVYTQPSQTIGKANIPINSEIAIPNLEKLAKNYIGNYNAKGFITNLCNALGLPMKNQSSQYGEVEIPFINPTCKASLRITAHNANAENNIKHDANYPYNLSIVVRNKMRRNTFHAHDDVFMDEFAYYGDRWKSIESPMSQIITSIIQFLKTGIYKDTTGVALTNVSPDSRKSNQNSLLSPPLDSTTQSRYNIPTNISDVDGTNQPANAWGADYVSESKNIYKYNQNNCNRNMKNKQVVRLTESQLRNMIAESVNRILEEGMFDTAKAMYQGAMNGMRNNRTVNQQRRDGANAVNGYLNVAAGFAEQIMEFCQNKGLDAQKLIKYIENEVLGKNNNNYYNQEFEISTNADFDKRF